MPTARALTSGSPQLLHARSFARGEICTQRFGDSFSQFALQGEKIRQLAIESISPMCASAR
jgi:hypothetical protein